MILSRRVIGMVPETFPEAGKAIEALSLSFAGGVSIEAWTWGATLAAVHVPDRQGTYANVCHRLPSIEGQIDTHRHHFIGSVLGRFGRCVSGGKFELDGEEHQLERNIGSHHFHGGRWGLHSRLWQAHAFAGDEKLTIRLQITSEHGDSGYPGRLSVQTLYELDRHGTLSIHFTAFADRPTIVGLVSHAFWNLAGQGKVDDQTLRLASTSQIPMDNEFIPLPGPCQSIVGTTLDFQIGRIIGPQAIDNCFLSTGPQDRLLEMHDPLSGRRMLVSSDQPALALYSGDHLPSPRAGLCIQPSAFPDAPNRPDYPSCRLDLGQVYKSSSVFRLDVLP